MANNVFTPPFGADNTMRALTGGTLSFVVGSTTIATITSLGLTVAGYVNINNNALLYGDASNILSQRNGTSGQEQRVYNTYTDASNGEWGFLQWASNIFVVGTTKNGTGTNRALRFSVGGTVAANVSTSGSWTNLGSMEVLSGGYYYWNGRAGMYSPADGVIRMVNNAGTSFTRLNFGGDTSSFPALSRNAAAVEAKLADNSGFALLKGKLQTDTNYTAGAPAATGYLTIYDGAGTAYRIPAVV